MEKQQQIVVIAVIHSQNGDILISRRNDDYTPDAHNKWALVGGKVEYGESPEEALAREVLEETGLEINNAMLLPKAFEQFWTNKHGEEYQVILLPYRCYITDESSLRHGLDPKIAELKFINPSQISEYDFLPLDVEMAELSLQTINS